MCLLPACSCWGRSSSPWAMAAQSTAYSYITWVGAAIVGTAGSTLAAGAPRSQHSTFFTSMHAARLDLDFAAVLNIFVKNPWLP